jgi:hypothetical protein
MPRPGQASAAIHIRPSMCAAAYGFLLYMHKLHSDFAASACTDGERRPPGSAEQLLEAGAASPARHAAGSLGIFLVLCKQKHQRATVSTSFYA